MSFDLYAQSTYSTSRVKHNRHQRYSRTKEAEGIVIDANEVDSWIDMLIAHDLSIKYELTTIASSDI